MISVFVKMIRESIKPHFRPVCSYDIRPGDTLLSSDKAGFITVEVKQVVVSSLSNEVRILGKSESIPSWHAIVPLSCQLWRQVP